MRKRLKGEQDQQESPLNKEKKENKRHFGAVEKFGECSSLTSGDCQPGIEAYCCSEAV